MIFPTAHSVVATLIGNRGCTDRSQNLARRSILSGEIPIQPAFTEQVVRILDGRKVNYLFIDGDHTYEGVKQDFETYSKLVDPHGLIAFHDIAPDRAKVPNHFVSVFWNEVKGRYAHEEFIRNPEQSKWGLGLISVDGMGV